MTMFFAKKLNKKGFTLAEMLIVVAIIAILVAIAIPIFTSSLENAEKAVFEADKRAIKAAGIAHILDKINTSEAVVKGTKGWSASATVDEKGNIGTVTVKAENKDVTETMFETWQGNKTGTPIKVAIKEVELMTGT